MNSFNLLYPSSPAIPSSYNPNLTKENPDDRADSHSGSEDGRGGYMHYPDLSQKLDTDLEGRRPLQDFVSDVLTLSCRGSQFSADISNSQRGRYTQTAHECIYDFCPKEAAPGLCRKPVYADRGNKQASEQRVEFHGPGKSTVLGIYCPYLITLSVGEAVLFGSGETIERGLQQQVP
jgi:hypothetical protein